MNQTTLSLEGQPTQPKVESPTGFFLQTWQKGLLLIVILGILYLRIWRAGQDADLQPLRKKESPAPEQLHEMRCAPDAGGMISPVAA